MDMGRQYNKREKRRRRKRYIERVKMRIRLLKAEKALVAGSGKMGS
ncbi:MAG: hypothetical protein N2561_05270 [Bacteroidetes bacterium]|nr:hypothetical protein [Bacteroidota bacterium]